MIGWRRESLRRPTANGLYKWMGRWWLLKEGIWHYTEDEPTKGLCIWKPCGVPSPYPVPPAVGRYVWYEADESSPK